MHQKWAEMCKKFTQTLLDPIREEISITTILHKPRLHGWHGQWACRSKTVKMYYATIVILIMLIQNIELESLIDWFIIIHESFDL